MAGGSFADVATDSFLGEQKDHHFIFCWNKGSVVWPTYLVSGFSKDKIRQFFDLAQEELRERNIGVELRFSLRQLSSIPAQFTHIGDKIVGEEGEIRDDKPSSRSNRGINLVQKGI